MISELRNLPAPAKLNLFLHVTGQRGDGYHLLETAFELIDLCDRVDLLNRDDGQIVLSDSPVDVPPEANLVVRAARALAALSNRRLGVSIGLTKRIPIGGGLGGGSSDAATVLLGLNRLWNLQFPNRTLAQIGLKLGADVPVFVFGRTAWGRGIGERLRAIELPQTQYLVVQPPVQVPTAVIFQSPELTRDTKPLKIMGFSLEPQNLASSLTAAIAAGQNDLQSVAQKLYPQVAQVVEFLRQIAGEFGFDANSVRMTGSGSCVYARLENGFGNASGVGAALNRNYALLEKVLSARPQLLSGAWVVKSLARHPMA